MVMMRRQVLVGLLLVGCLGSWALAGSAAPERFLIPQVAPKALTIDGDLKDWNSVDAGFLIDQNNLAGGHCDAFKGEADCQGRLRMAYDATYVYAALTVTDDSVCGLEAKSKVPGKFWEQDGLGLYLDAPACNNASGRYNTKATHPWQTEPILQLTPGSERFGADVLPEGSSYACVTAKNSYTVEVAVPWASIGWRPQAGDRVFFMAILADYDRQADGKLTPLRQLLWHFPKYDTRPVSRGWAEARLMSPDGFGAEMITTAPVAIRGSTMAWKLMADAVKSGWQITRVSLIGEGFKTQVLAEPKAAVDAGKQALLSGEFETADLKPGNYTIVAEAKSGRKSDSVSQSLRVVESGSLLTGSNTGELPKQYFTPDPLRPAAGWLPPHRPVTHADYMTFVKTEIEAGWPSFEYHLKNKNTALGGGWYQEYGLRMSAWAKVTKDPVWIQRAQGMFEMADAAYRTNNYAGLGWINFPLIYYYRQNLVAVDGWKPEYQAMVQDWYRHAFPFPKERSGIWFGMNNWGLSSGIRGVIGAYWLGDQLPDKALWEAHVKETWGDFIGRVKDIDENTTNYAPWDLWLILFYLDATGQTDLLKTDAVLRDLFERYIHEVAPSGARPQYGSTNGWHDSPWVWMYIFERVGMILNDGRYKAQARLMWEYSIRHVEDWHQYHLVYDGAVTWLARILAEMPDDSMPAMPVESKSRVTVRGAMRMLTPQERDARRMWVDTMPEKVPGKIVLRGSLSGNPHDPNSLFSLIELNGDAGHCAARPTSVNCLMANESVLLSSQGYYEQDPQFHNMMWIEDLEGTQGIQSDMAIKVPVFEEGKTITYAVAEVERFMRWPATVRRHYVFMKDRFLWVRDEVAFKSTFFARLGPSWLSRQVQGGDGKTWFNSYFDIMPYTGLGQGGGMHRWRNNAYDLLTYLVPRPGTELVMSDLTSHNYYMNAPLRARQVWRGLAKDGQTKVFDSLLIPHAVKAKQESGEWLAKSIQPISTAEPQTAVMFETPVQTSVGPVMDKVLVVFSDKPFSGGGVSTDAKMAVVVWRGKDVINWYVYQGTTLKVGDQALLSSPAPVNQEH